MLESERLELREPNHRIPGPFGHACRGFGTRRSISLHLCRAYGPPMAERSRNNVTCPTAKTRAHRLVAAAVSEPHGGGE